MPGDDGCKFMTLLCLCYLDHSAGQPTYLHDHLRDHILFPSDQDTIVIKICEFVAHNPNRVFYRWYHHINIADLQSDLKNPLCQISCQF